MTDTEDTDNDDPRTADRGRKGKGKKADGKKNPRLRLVGDEPPPDQNPADYKTIPALRDFVDRIADGREVVQRNFLSVAVLKAREASDQGYRPAWTTIRWRRDGTIASRDHESPTEDEQKAICDAFATIPADKIPRSIPTTKAAAETKRLEVGAARENWHVILDRHRKDAVMCQQRVDEQDGGKRYLPWTFWSDGRWYCMEPDALLPPWKPEKKRTRARIMIHEGAQAARYVDHLLHDVGIAADQARANHPWAVELSLYEHWGWIGGADRPEATDWSEVLAEKPIEVAIVCDNDAMGIAAAPRIARKLGQLVVDVVRFDDRFKLNHDLADPLPKKFWDEKKKDKYIGPSLDDLTSPATWATDVIPTGGKGRPAHKLRREFAAEWLRSVSPPVFVHKRRMDRLLSETQFNDTIGPFSDATDTARLFNDHYPSLCDNLAYLPGEEPGIITRDGQRSINTFRPSSVRSIKGDARPWHEYMEMLITDKDDRKELLRWCVTLVARLGVKMEYAILLVSTAQGIGKGTLANILAALVGGHNTSRPTEEQIVGSSFNAWTAHKRLALIDEIYSGQSRKAYDRLKTPITEPKIDVQRKYMEEYTIDNYVHIFACSNWIKALHLDDEDRRWFAPRVTEEVLPKKYWVDFYAWLAADGLGIIRHWMEEHIEEPDVGVSRGEHAPTSSMKQEVIKESRSEGQQLIHDLCQMVLDQQREKFILVVSDVRLWLANHRELDLSSDKLEKPLTIRKVLKGAGLKEPAQRFMIDGRHTHVAANFLIESTVQWPEISEHRIRPNEIWPVPSSRV